MSTQHRSRKKMVLRILAGIIGAAVVVAAGMSALTWRLPFAGPVSEEKAAQQRSTSQQEDIAYWTCVMHPSVHQSGPGKCPVCGMDLVPVKKGAGLTLTEKQRQLIPIKTEPVGFHSLNREIRSVGTLEFNERKLAYVSPRISGWIEDVFVDFTGTKVREGDHLVKIYSRELLPAQQDYLGRLKYLSNVSGEGDQARKEAEDDVAEAEDKLLLLGLTRQQVEEIKQRGKVQTHLVLYAPMGGTVIEMNAYRGRHMKEGENLYKIADLSSLWMIADIYEYEMPWVREGQEVEIISEAYPGETFTGKVWFIYPYLRAETRTLKLLVEVPNPDERLKPGTWVTARLKISLRDIYRPSAKPPYACPMHPWITSDKPGKCSICGMDLERTAPPPKEEEAAPESYWTCPMHPQIREKGPGTCALCGMKLVEKKLQKPQTMTVLTCGMPGHQQFVRGTEPKDGKCPVCGMKLVEKEVSVAAPGEEPCLRFKYVCPDHPGQVAAEPGKCPLDGKELVMTDEVLSVPKSAVINTGKRTVVYVEAAQAGYIPRNVVLGPEASAIQDGVRRRFYPILSGLQPGETVVTQGNFLIDSQSQITGQAAAAYGGAIGEEEAAETPPAHKQ